MTLDPEFIGYELIQKGFPTWFRYMFRVVENRPFLIEGLHSDLLEIFQNVYEGKSIRQIINLPPRSAKTTLSAYFVVYGFTVNPKCEFIYTSYSQELLKEISQKCASIMEHPVYKAMYPNKSIFIENIETDPINDFWREYLQKNENKNTYSSKLIRTTAGGKCLFMACGGQITGFGVGIRNAKGFTGALIMDDLNKPNDIKYEKRRKNVLDYYEGTLLNRLNNSNAPIINIQQRLHTEDISGLLIKKYNFNLLKKPLLNEQGICQIPSQYTLERIKELQANNYYFQSQFQQEPFIKGGEVIKREWFNYYDSSKKYKYKRLIITADTAMKVKEHNDYSVFMAGGLTQENKLHVLDMIRGKWEAPELEKRAVEFWNRFKDINAYGTTVSGLYVEDRASGIGLIQSLKTKYSMPIFGLQVENDKLAKVEGVTPYIESGLVLLPDNENALFNPDLLAECEEFSRDDSHAHDDVTDTLAYLIMEMLSKREVSLLDFFMQ